VHHEMTITMGGRAIDKLLPRENQSRKLRD
jgi:hypothetical protein